MQLSISARFKAPDSDAYARGQLYTWILEPPISVQTNSGAQAEVQCLSDHRPVPQVAQRAAPIVRDATVGQQQMWICSTSSQGPAASIHVVP
jgi:hypothetical protein